MVVGPKSECGFLLIDRENTVRPCRRRAGHKGVHDPFGSTASRHTFELGPYRLHVARWGAWRSLASQAAFLIRIERR